MASDKATTSDGREVDLELYQFDSCPYCQKVQRVITARGVRVRLRDTMREPGARDELIARGGKAQVPCLFIDGAPLYESDDIVAWIEAHCA